MMPQMTVVIGVIASLNTGINKVFNRLSISTTVLDDVIIANNIIKNDVHVHYHKPTFHIATCVYISM